MNAVINYKAPRRGLAVSFKQLPGPRMHAGYGRGRLAPLAPATRARARKQAPPTPQSQTEVTSGCRRLMNYIKKSKKKATSPRLLHYTRLNHTTLDYTRLNYTALNHTTLHYTARHCPTLRYPTLHCTALRYTQLDYATHHVISAEPHMLCACVHVLARVYV